MVYEMQHKLENVRVKTSNEMTKEGDIQVVHASKCLTDIVRNEKWEKSNE